MELIIKGIDYLIAHPQYVAFALATLGAYLKRSPLKSQQTPKPKKK